LHGRSIIKKVIYLLVFSLYSFTVNAQSLKVGLIDYPPHINFDENLNKSPLYQYVNSILLPLSLQVEFIKLPRKRATIELRKGNIDLLLPGSISLENETKKRLSSSIFQSVSGLCFKKENFIPILSATHRFDDLTIGLHIDSAVVSSLKNSKAKMVYISGKNATERGIEMTQKGRIDAFYHPSPINIYHRKNLLYKDIACSYFHGYSTPVYILVSNSLSTKKMKLIDKAFQDAMLKQTYEYYFANRNNS